MTSSILKIFTLIIFAGLSACGSILDLGQDRVADSIYSLAPPMNEQNSMVGDEKILLLGQINFPAYVKSEKITVKPNGNEIQFMAEARWSDQASSLIADYLRVSLDGADGWMVVDRKHAVLDHDFRLDLDVRDFSMHVSEGSAPEIVFQVAADMFQSNPLTLVSRKSFTAQVRARENTQAAIIAAFNEAVEDVSGEIKAWITQATD